MKEYLNKRGHSMRRIALYMGLTMIAAAVLGIVGERLGWSDGVSLAVTAAVCGPLSLAGLGDGPLDWILGPREGRRSSRRPTP